MVEKKKKEDMTTIQVEKKLAAQLRKLGDMDDNYSTVIRRLIEGNGKPQEREITGEHE